MIIRYEPGNPEVKLNARPNDEVLQATFDQLITMSPPSSSPKRRNPAARTVNNLAFLDETTPEELKSYSPVQVGTILKQKTQVCKLRHTVLRECQVPQAQNA